MREERIRDLGGLALEMVRRDAYRDDLLVDRCAEIFALEARLHELDAMLAGRAASHRAVPTARCACGAPVLAGAHFCANCGRPAGEAPVIACPSCGHALPADANFCAVCGQRALLGPDAEAAAGAALPAGDREPAADATVVRPTAANPGNGASAGGPGEP